MIDFEKDFAIFILSYGRADKINTLEMLQRAGYKGNWYVVVSTDGKQLDKYKKVIRKENLLVFDKQKIVCDTMISRSKFEPRSSLYARNFIADYASTRYKYFLMSDDDIRDVKFKIDNNGHIKDGNATKVLNEIISIFCNYLESAKNLASVALAIGSGYFGGVNSIYKIEREVCCFMFFKSSHLRHWRGVFCEDVLLSTGNIDQVYLTYRGACVLMPKQASNGGGVNYDPHKLPPYLFWHTAAPSSVKCVGLMSRKRVNKNLYPCIISEEYKK